MTLDWVRPAQEKKLPVVLSTAEVRLILGCLRRPHYRVCLTTIYSCGLRLLEGVFLQVSAIDGERKMLHVRQGKGNKDRYKQSMVSSEAPPSLNVSIRSRLDTQTVLRFSRLAQCISDASSAPKKACACLRATTSASNDRISPWTISNSTVETILEPPLRDPVLWRLSILASGQGLVGL